MLGSEIKTKGIDMYYNVKTMLEHGKNILTIARDLGIDLKTLRKIRDKVKNGEIKTPVMKRRSKLDSYKEEIIGYLEKGFFRSINSSGTRKKSVNITYSWVKKYVRNISTLTILR